MTLNVDSMYITTKYNFHDIASSVAPIPLSSENNVYIRFALPISNYSLLGGIIDTGMYGTLRCANT